MLVVPKVPVPIEMAAARDGVPGFRKALEEHWRPMWRGMGVEQVAAQVMAGAGPAVDETAWKALKIREAAQWVREELAKDDNEKATTRWRATVSFWLSIFAVCISLGALLIAGGTFGLRWWG